MPFATQASRARSPEHTGAGDDAAAAAAGAASAASPAANAVRLSLAERRQAQQRLHSQSSKSLRKRQGLLTPPPVPDMTPVSAAASVDRLKQLASPVARRCMPEPEPELQPPPSDRCENGKRTRLTCWALLVVTIPCSDEHRPFAKTGSGQAYVRNIAQPHTHTKRKRNVCFPAGGSRGLSV